MITTIQALSAVLAGLIAAAVHDSHNTPRPIVIVAYLVAASIATLCWGVGRIYRKDTR